MKLKNIFAGLILSMACVVIISCSKSGGTGNTNGYGNGNGTGGTGGNSSAVNINGMSFTPASITVKVGTTVKWTNSDYYSAHTVTSNDGTTFNSGSIASGGTYSYTPTAAGTYPYYCTIHGTAMAGTLVVNP